MLSLTANQSAFTGGTLHRKKSLSLTVIKTLLFTEIHFGSVWTSDNTLSDHWMNTQHV